MFVQSLIGLLFLITLSTQKSIVWEHLEDICYFNRSEVNSVDYVKTRCELVAGVQVQKRFYKDDFYWCIAIDNGDDVDIEDYASIKTNVVVPVAAEFIKNRTDTNYHITNIEGDKYYATYLKGQHNISVIFSTENKLLSLKLNDTESCDHARLNEDDPIYPNQINKNPLKFFEKCVELNSVRETPDHEYCEDIDIVNFRHLILSGRYIFNCITVNKSVAADQYDDDKMLELILYIGGNYTLRWSDTASNILTAHSNDEFLFHVKDTIIISVEPKADKHQHYMQNILVNNVTNCKPIHTSEYCGSVETNRQFEFFEYPTYPGQYPWQVAIYKYSADNMEKIHICDGTFIDENVIVTAAHCLLENGTQWTKNRISMTIGQFDMRVLSFYAKELNDIKSVVVHPNFNTETWENDIALLITQTRFESNDYVSRLCFKSNNDALYTQSYGLVPSWPANSENEFQFILSEAKIIFDTNNTCDGVHSSTEICGRYDFDGTSACVKDGGGLNVHFGPGFFLRGIVSRRNSDDDKCQNGEQVIFTDIIKYAKWIKSNYYPNKV